MKVESFEYPINWENVNRHHEATLLGKEYQEGVNYSRCSCCHRRIGKMAKYSLCEDIDDKYGKYGPNTVIFLGMIIRLFYLTMVCTLIFSVYALIENFQGNYCNSKGICSMRNLIEYWSIYNQLGHPQKLRIQLYIWTAIEIILIGFNFYLRYYSLRKYEKINNKNITDADYSIILRRLPQETTQQDIRDLVQNQLQANDEMENEGKFERNMEIEKIIMIYSLQETNKDLDKKIDQFKDCIKEKRQQQFDKNRLNIRLPIRFAQAAIVKFSSSLAKESISIKTPVREEIISYFFPFFKPRCQYQIRGKAISIEKAPHPTDIIWEHFGRSEKERVLRKILFTALNIVLLAISCGVMVGLGEWGDKIERDTGEVSLGLTIFTALIVFVFNRSLLGWIIAKATKKHYLDTKSDQDIELMQKNVMHEAINLGLFAIFVPFLVKLPNVFDGARAVKLPLNMLITICIQAFGLPLQEFLSLVFRVKWRIMRKLAKKKKIILTQTEANSTFKGPHIEFVEAYAIKVQLIWFGFAFSTVSPICLPIAMFGIILSYFLQRLLYCKIYSIPEYGAPRINSEFIDLLDGTPLFIALINFFLHQIYVFSTGIEMDPGIERILYVNLGIALFSFFMPWGNLINCLNFDIKAKENVPYKEAKIQLTYEAFNPAYRNINEVIAQTQVVNIRPKRNKISFKGRGSINVQKDEKLKQKNTEIQAPRKEDEVINFDVQNSDPIKEDQDKAKSAQPGSKIRKVRRTSSNNSQNNRNTHSLLGTDGQLKVSDQGSNYPTERNLLSSGFS